MRKNSWSNSAATIGAEVQIHDDDPHALPELPPLRPLHFDQRHIPGWQTTPVGVGPTRVGKCAHSGEVATALGKFADEVLPKRAGRTFIRPVDDSDQTMPFAQRLPNLRMRLHDGF